MRPPAARAAMDKISHGVDFRHHPMETALNWVPGVSSFDANSSRTRARGAALAARARGQHPGSNNCVEGRINHCGCGHARARGARRFQRARPAERPARAAWATLRLLADVAISFSRNSVRGDDGARAVGATDDGMMRPPRDEVADCYWFDDGRARYRS